MMNYRRKEMEVFRVFMRAYPVSKEEILLKIESENEKEYQRKLQKCPKLFIRFMHRRSVKSTVSKLYSSKILFDALNKL